MKACLIMPWEMEGQLRQRHFWHIQRIWFWNKALLTKQLRRLFCQNLKSSSCQILEISAFCFLLAPGNPASLNFSCAPTGAIKYSTGALVLWCCLVPWSAGALHNRRQHPVTLSLRSSLCLQTVQFQIVNRICSFQNTQPSWHLRVSLSVQESESQDCKILIDRI